MNKWKASWMKGIITIVLLTAVICGCTIYPVGVQAPDSSYKQGYYIDIQEPTDLYLRGKVVATVQPGATLKILNSKLCLNNRGVCFVVVDEKNEARGIVSETRMNLKNRIYKKDN